MSLALDDASLRKPIARWTTLPPRMRVLYITTYHRTGGWLAEAFASDSAVDVVMEEAVGLKAGLTRLRDEVFDAVLVSHEPGELNALELLDGLRAGGSSEPFIVLGAQSEQELAPLCYEVGADAYVCVNTTTTRHLIWTVARAFEHQRLNRENHRLAQAEQHRLRLEHQESQRLLDDQRALLRDLELLGETGRVAQGTSEHEPNEADALASSASATLARHTAVEELIPLPPRLIEHYRELLRTYVIMGSGNMACEMSMLADLLSAAKVSASQALNMHLGVVEELVRGLGRSARHVMTRADLLVLEVLVHLSESYRRRLFEKRVTLQQMILPGFDAPDSRGVRAMSDQQATVAQLRQLVAEFVRERNWEQFHTPKNLAMSLAIEAAELMEHFQWLTPEQSLALAGEPEKVAAAGEELADVTCYVLALANALGLDLSEAVQAKMVKNRVKYPVGKC